MSHICFHRANKAVLSALAKDQPSQLAQLIALEHFLAGGWPTLSRLSAQAMLKFACWLLDHEGVIG